jgi:hypothetical protein
MLPPLRPSRDPPVERRYEYIPPVQLHIEPSAAVADNRKTLPATLAFECRIMQEIRRMQLAIHELTRVQREMKETVETAMGVPVSLKVGILIILI